ncbi:MAG: polysaccharide pyruvyl transferase family protein [Clostridia bacterium]|nr:polysaccharide pyruvyl transferase family protein [Clostridia bacterium]
MAGIGIITFLHNDNFGSALQAYALQRTVRELGYECFHLDYQPDRAEKIRNLLASGNNPKLILEGIRKREVRADQSGARRKSEAIPAFYQRRMRLSPPCRNRRELREAGRNCDLLLCGSDQIWNPVWLNPAYFLTFADNDIPKAAYAASLGVSRLPKAAKIRKIRRWTRDFRAISIREQEGADLLEQMTGRKAPVMPDPVCLLSAEEWNEIAGKEPDGEPYLLCYFIGSNPDYRDRVRTLQQETGLRVLVLPVTAESYRSGYELLDGAGPEDFLSAVRGASMFCTDSFHGLVFGTLYGIRTELIRRYREDDPESKNSRVDHFRRLAAEKGMAELRTAGREWLKDVIQNS